MKSYQYILLDWDGNIAKTLHIWLESTINVLKKHGHKHTEAEVIDGLSDLQTMFKQFGIVNITELVEEIKLEIQTHLPNIELYPDALFVLEILKSKGKQLALVTSSNRHLVTHTLAKYNISNLFDVIVTREDVLYPKPHPQPLEIALVKLSGSKDKAIMIGDSDKDLDAANNTGVNSILFFPPEHARFYDLDKFKECKPTHIISDFRKVLDIVN